MNKYMENIFWNEGLRAICVNVVNWPMRVYEELYDRSEMVKRSKSI